MDIESVTAYHCTPILEVEQSHAKAEAITVTTVATTATAVATPATAEETTMVYSLTEEHLRINTARRTDPSAKLDYIPKLSRKGDQGPFSRSRTETPTSLLRDKCTLTPEKSSQWQDLVR